MEIAGKTAVVTGAGSGIGRAIALALARRGAKVVVSDIEAERADTVAAEIITLGGQAKPFASDVTSEVSVEELARSAWDAYGPVELVFCNAGVIAMGQALDFTTADLKWLFDVNVFGAWYCYRSFGNRLLQAGRSGWFCTTASESAIGMSSTGSALYTGTKHAILGITDVCRHEYQGRLGFSLLCPGAVNTGIWDAARNRPARYGGPAEGSKFAELAMHYGLDPSEVGALAVSGVEREEFLIFTHPHDRDVAERRWQDISQAIDRQWPEGPTPAHHSSAEIVQLVIEQTRDRQASP